MVQEKIDNIEKLIGAMKESAFDINGKKRLGGYRSMAMDEIHYLFVEANGYPPKASQEVFLHRKPWPLSMRYVSPEERKRRLDRTGEMVLKSARRIAGDGSVLDMEAAAQSAMHFTEKLFRDALAMQETL